MDLSTGTARETRLYKAKPWVLALNLVSLLLCVLIIGLPAAAGIAGISAVANSAEFPTALQVMVLCLFTPLIAVMALLLLEMIILTVSNFFAFLKIGPQGIENKLWPFRHIRAGWGDLDRLEKYFYYDALYLKDYEVIGPSLSFSGPLKRLNLIQPLISLGSYRGWPDGQLAADLRQYAPQLFAQQVVQENKAAVPQTPNMPTQEQRLLAAISHAAVLLSGIGMFVPLLIYFNQRKTSPFVAEQARQAFYYQLVVGLTALLAPLCITGVIVIPAVIAVINQAQELLLVVSVTLAIGITLLVAFASLAFSIYGVVGAVQSYRGRAFRYIPRKRPAGQESGRPEFLFDKQP